MSEIALFAGYILLVLGGALLGGIILFTLGQLLCAAWVGLRRKARLIVEEETLILDYKKNREKFLEWREGEENMWKGRWEDYGG